MPAQFVNFEAANISALGAGGLARHKRADLRDEHTEKGPRAGIKPVPLVDEGAQLQTALEAIEKDRRGRSGERGRRPAGCYNVLLTGPPRYDGLNGGPLSEDDELKWASACIVWLKNSLPDGVIIAAAYLHRDEAAPHVHVTIVPWCEETNQIDWRTVRARMAGREPRPKLELKGMSGKNAPSAQKAKARNIKAADRRAAGEEMKAILDSFHAEVSAPFGIERVKGGQGRRHRAVDRRVAAELEAKGAEAVAERARADQAAAQASADQAKRDARAAELRRNRARRERDKARKDAGAWRTRAARVREESARADRAEAKLVEVESERDQAREDLERVTHERDGAHTDAAATRQFLSEKLGDIRRLEKSADDAKSEHEAELKRVREEGRREGHKAGERAEHKRITTLVAGFIEAVPAASEVVRMLLRWVRAQAKTKARERTASRGPDR